MKRFKSRREIKKLAENIQFGQYIVDEYKCNEDDIITLLKELKYSVDEFSKNGFILDNMLLISATGEDSIFVSTRGLVSKGCISNRFYLAYTSQASTMKLILSEIGRLLKQRDINFVGSHNYEELNSLSIALIHNYTFYLEIYAKAYLSLSNTNFDYIHDLNALLILVEETTNNLGQTNSIFHSKFKEAVSQMTSIIQNISSNGKLNSVQSSFKYGMYYDDYLIHLDIDSFEDLYSSIQHDQSLLDYYDQKRENDFFKGSRY